MSCMASSRASIAWVGACLALSGCTREEPFDSAAIRARLDAAGYAVTPAKVPDALAKYPSVSCIDARKGRGLDTFCVIRCKSAGECANVIGNTGESYGDFQRGASVLVHEMCTTDTHSELHADCRPARAALGL